MCVVIHQQAASSGPMAAYLHTTDSRETKFLKSVNLILTYLAAILMKMSVLQM